MDISKSIRDLRERHDMTQEQFGKIADVSAMAVSQWENGRAVPRMSAIQKLSDYFGIPKSQIIGDSIGASAISILSKLEAIALDEYTEDERELLHLFRYMDEQGKQHVMQTARMCAALTEKDGAVNPKDVGRAGIPVAK